MDHVEMKMPKISVQESVEAVENAFSERIPERMCEQIRVGQVAQDLKPGQCRGSKSCPFGSNFRKDV